MDSGTLEPAGGGWRNKMITERPDAGDIDALESLLSTEGWRILWTRVTETVEQKRDELERDTKEGRAIPYAQGFISACRMVLAMPQSLMAEFKSQIGEK